MTRTTKLLVGTAVLLLTAGLAVWADDPIPLVPPIGVPQPKVLQVASQHDDGVTSLRVLQNVVESGPVLPPVETLSVGNVGGGSFSPASGLAGFSGSTAVAGGGGGSNAMASVERSLRGLARRLR